MLSSRSIWLCIPAMVMASAVTCANDHGVVESDREKLRGLLDQCTPLQLRFPSNVGFSAKLSVGVGPEKARTWTTFEVSASPSDGKASVVIRNDGRLHAIVQDSIVVSFHADGGERMRMIRGGGFEFSLGANEHGAASFAFGSTRSRLGRSRISIRPEEIVRAALDRADKVEFDVKEQRGVLVTENRRVIVSFTDGDERLIREVRVEAAGEGGDAIVLSDIAKAPRDGVYAAEHARLIWEALGYLTVETDIAGLSAVDILPGADLAATDRGDEQIMRLEQLLNRWPRSTMRIVGEKLQNDAEVPADILALRTEARHIALQRQGYRRMDRLRELMASDDAYVRAQAMLSVGHPLRDDPIDKHALLMLIQTGLRDESPHVRTLALSRLALLVHQNVLGIDALLVDLKMVLENDHSVDELRSIAYVLYKVSEGKMALEGYPQNEQGWPRYDSAAWAWWLVHEDEIRERAKRWLAAQHVE